MPEGENTKTPDVSVVIPTYNRASFVSEAIDSVLGQDGVSVEVLVVDDGSSDGTAEVISRFGKYVQYIRQARAGASAARNTGIRAATAKWVALLDSDDVWMPGKLAHQFSDLRAYPRAVAHFTSSLIERPFVGKDDLVAIRGISHYFESGHSRFFERPLAFNLRHNFARNQSALIRRDVLLTCGLFDESYRYFQDTDLMNRVALEGPWVVSPAVLVHEIRRKETTVGIGEQRSRELYAGYETLVDQMNRLLDDDRLTGKERRLARKRLSEYAFLAATQWIRAGSNQDARKVLASAYRRSLSPKNIATHLLSLAPNPVLRKFVFR